MSKKAKFHTYQVDVLIEDTDTVYVKAKSKRSAMQKVEKEYGYHKDDMINVSIKK